MERKTTGAFIAALRKANGMTQKELAERLNVSDKTVSRWERDDGAPDLSVIPVIAEVFGVTCDELLRGERKSTGARTADPDPQTSVKGEKERRRLLNVTLSQYQSFTLIAIGISVVGLIAALMCNLAFLRASLGFLIGAVFFAASIVCQAIFVNRAFLSVADAELEAEELLRFKVRVIRLAQRSIGITVVLIGFTFPLVLIEAFIGLGADSMLLFGTIGSTIFLLFYAVICYFLNARLLKQGVFALPAAESEVYWRRHKLKKQVALGLVIVMAVTLVLQIITTTVLDGYRLANGITFTDYDSFAAFMEQPKDWDGTSFYDEVPHSTVPNGTVYFDEFGNEISEEEALKEQLTLSDGTVVCEYLRLNHSVSHIRYGKESSGYLPITVITHDALRDGFARVSLIHAAFAALYFVECAAAVVLYRKKR